MQRCGDEKETEDSQLMEIHWSILYKSELPSPPFIKEMQRITSRTASMEAILAIKYNIMKW